MKAMVDAAQAPATSSAATAKSKLFARLKTSFATGQLTTPTIPTAPTVPTASPAAPTPAVPPTPTAPPPAVLEPAVTPEPVQPVQLVQPANPPSVLDQAVPVMVQQTDPLNPPRAAGSMAKEQAQVFTLEHPAVDHPGGMQSAEELRNPEIPLEVESYLQKVENHQEQLPKEVVVADATTAQPTNHYLAQPVIVLPITQAAEKAGARKGPKFSIRWLVEWSWKVMKMFKGKVVYRQA